MKQFGNEQLVALVIDEDRKTLERVRETLSGANFACACCTSPEEAIAAAETTPPQLILCDANLRGESSLDTCEQIKRLPGLEDVPVMFLSGVQLPDIIRRSHTAGGIYCLRKPFDANVLLELIDQALGASEGYACSH